MLPLNDILAALAKRWRLELLVFLAVLGLVLVATMLSPKTYVASSSLLFDEPTADPVQGTQTSQDSVNALLITQSDVIRSDAVAAEVVRSLSLATPEVVAQWQAATGGTGDVETWYGRKLLRGLTVVPGKGSRVLAVQYLSNDPQAAAVLADGFAAAYLSTRLKLRTDPARTYARWFGDRIREVRTNWEQAQARLTAFKKKTGIVDTAGQASAEATRLGELSAQLTGAEASAAEMGARAGRNAAASPDVQTSPVVLQLRGQIALKAAQVSQLSTVLGPNHPDRMAAQAELGTLRAKLAGEVGNATQTVRAASGAASGKEATLRQKLDAQRGRMLGLVGENGELDVLQRDVDVAKAAYDGVTTRLQTMRLQSVAPESNARPLDRATVPSLPSTPNVPLRVLLGSVLGALIALATGIVLELWRPRVRSARTVTAISGAPVLAAVKLSRSSVGPLLEAAR